MRGLFARQRSVYPVQRCHFCSTESRIVPPHPTDDKDDNITTTTTTAAASSSTYTATQISTGTISSWFCSSCQCWNRADPSQVGGIATWEQKMSDEQQNITSFQQRATAPPLAPFSSASTSSASPFSSSSTALFASVSPFCHSCQTNQTLILSIMANGDTEDMDEEAVKEWQSSLELRYPPVCAQCQEMVSDRIERADKLARKLIWHGWLSKSRGKQSAQTRSPFDPNKVHSDSPGKPTGTHLGPVWVAQSTAFVVGAAVGLMTALRGSDFVRLEKALILTCLLVFHALSSPWDPTLPGQVQLRKRVSPVSSIKVKGREAFRQAQSWLLAIRCIHLLIVSTDWLPSSLSKAASTCHVLTTISLVAQSIVTVYGFRQLRVVEPHSISLKSKAASYLANKAAPIDAAHDASFSLLSLESHNPNGTNQQPKEEDTMAEVQVEAEVEMMDWSPTPVDATPTLARVDSNFQLGPQRFFEPLRKTGLEDLLDRSLALDEAKRPFCSKAKGKARKASTMMLASGVVVAALLAFASLAIGGDQFQATMIQLKMHWLHETLSMATEGMARLGRQVRTKSKG